MKPTMTAMAQPPDLEGLSIIIMMANDVPGPATTLAWKSNRHSTSRPEMSANLIMSLLLYVHSSRLSQFVDQGFDVLARITIKSEALQSRQRFGCLAAQTLQEVLFKQ